MVELFKNGQVELSKDIDESGNVNISVRFNAGIDKAEIDVFYEVISCALHRRYGEWLDLYNIENYQNNYRNNSRLENLIDNEKY
ncbi:MAG: hypothetical protein KJ593_04855 [Candidatus Omnitrophica bacterium]|nr:hypothetical protein [Candidatus Omnitrophota bacterium]